MDCKRTSVDVRTYLNLTLVLIHNDAMTQSCNYDMFVTWDLPICLSVKSSYGELLYPNNKAEDFKVIADKFWSLVVQHVRIYSIMHDLIVQEYCRYLGGVAFRCGDHS